jgi:hypothetical protein
VVGELWEGVSEAEKGASANKTICADL